MGKSILKLSSLILMLLFVSIQIQAQETSAGKCYTLDYELWKATDYPDVHGNCGSSDIFNPGSEFTMEVWVRAYTFGLNMKIMGRTSLSFDNGYIMGFENMHLYSQIFNPDNQEIPRSGNGPMEQDSAWFHLSTTYSATGKMINYINGIEVGSRTIYPQNSISASSEPFIIGRAPWDFAWAYNGDIDEIRLWNSVRTPEEIKEFMFKELKGDESNLLAYYNFNAPNEASFFDKTANANHGTINNYEEECFFWDNSYAPVGDLVMYEMKDVHANWFGKSSSEYSYAVTENGLSILANGINEKEFEKYIVFGHNEGTGITENNAPVNAPVDFRRLERTWYLNQGGSFKSQAVFNLDDGANGGELLTIGGNENLYTLLYRSDENDDFTAVNSASEIHGSVVMFNSVELKDGYYTISYSSEQLADPTTGINQSYYKQIIDVFPNPASDYVNITNAANFKVEMYDMLGEKLWAGNITDNEYRINLNGIKKGLYILYFKNENKAFTERIIITE